MPIKIRTKPTIQILALSGLSGKIEKNRNIYIL
jgi:hypothetical protein